VVLREIVLCISRLTRNT